MTFPLSPNRQVAETAGQTCFSSVLRVHREPEQAEEWEGPSKPDDPPGRPWLPIPGHEAKISPKRYMIWRESFQNKHKCPHSPALGASQGPELPEGRGS